WSYMMIRFNPQGTVTMVFGRKQQSSDRETGPVERHKPPIPPEIGRFRQVTDVTWDPAGNVYISDGYINSRVAKTDKNGKWLKSFGEPGNKAGQLNTPHNIAADAQGNIYVADRGNRRTPVFDGEGKVLGVLGESGKQLKQFGWIHEIACPSENVLYVGELLNWRVQKLLLHPR